eukprot:c17085_g1_i1 orf=699-1937(-)
MCTHMCRHVTALELSHSLAGHYWTPVSVQSVSIPIKGPPLPHFSCKIYPLRKKSSRKRGGARKSRGWIHGTDLVDDSVPIVLSSRAFALAKLVRQETSREAIWKILDLSSPTHDTWDDIINVIVQLKRERDWLHAIQIGEWILETTKFRPDILCYNLLMDAYGRSHQLLEVERLFKQMRTARFLANEDTFNVLIRAYSNVGLINKAEATFIIMQKFGYKPGVATFNTLLEAFGKARDVKKAEEIFQKMDKFDCLPTANTFTQMINIYGKAGLLKRAERVFFSMAAAKCSPNICTYTVLMQAYAKEGLCMKAEEVFEALQVAGCEADVYVYNALLEAYSRGGFPMAAVEVLHTMRQMNCDPDRASYDILIDAFGRAGLVEGKLMISYYLFCISLKQGRFFLMPMQMQGNGSLR